MTCSTVEVNNTVDVGTTRSCLVNHSMNTVPHLRCSPELSIDNVFTIEIKQRDAICQVGQAAFNSTAFIVSGEDLDQAAKCTVSYLSLNDSSRIYSTEDFVIHPIQSSDPPPRLLAESTGKCQHSNLASSPIMWLFDVLLSPCYRVLCLTIVLHVHFYICCNVLFPV